MGNINQFRTDSDKEVSGVWVPLGSGLDIKLARLGNPKYRERLTELTRPIRHRIRRNLLEESELQEIENQAIARHVLLDWRGLTDYDENGEEVEVPYSEQAALKYLKQYEEFRKIVIDLSQDSELFKSHEDDKDENEELGKPSSGLPNTDLT